MSSSQLALALWGLCGAFIYAGSRLITAVLGEQEIGRRGLQRAWAQFGLALIFGPAAAVAFTPIIMDRIGENATLQAVAFAVGLSVNSAWPVIMEVILPSLRRVGRLWIADLYNHPGDQR